MKLRRQAEPIGHCPSDACLAIAAGEAMPKFYGPILLGVPSFLVAEQHNGLAPIHAIAPTSAWVIRATAVAMAIPAILSLDDLDVIERAGRCGWRAT